jgi:hypothetical protein
VVRAADLPARTVLTYRCGRGAGRSLCAGLVLDPGAKDLLTCYARARADHGRTAPIDLANCSFNKELDLPSSSISAFSAIAGSLPAGHPNVPLRCKVISEQPIVGISM